MEQKIFNSAAVYNLASSIEYANGAIVSKLLAKNHAGNITLLSFDKGQELSPHSTPSDAIVQVIDGEAKIMINNVEHILKSGEMIIMPANVTHSIEAIQKFKMILTMLKD